MQNHPSHPNHPKSRSQKNPNLIPFLRKTNPIPKTTKSTQPLSPQRVTRKNSLCQTKKNKPNQTQYSSGNLGRAYSKDGSPPTYHKSINFVPLCLSGYEQITQNKPNLKNEKTTQPLLLQRLTQIHHLSKTKKNKPNQTQSTTHKPVPNSVDGTTSDILHPKYETRTLTFTHISG